MASGLPDREAVKTVCSALSKPFNFMVGIPGWAFDVASLRASGVRRISMARLSMRRRKPAIKDTSGFVETGLPSPNLADT